MISKKLNLTTDPKFIHFSVWKRLEEKRFSKSEFIYKINKKLNLKKKIF